MFQSVKDKSKAAWDNREAIAKKGVDEFMSNPTGYIIATATTAVSFILGDIADSAERAANAAEVSALVALDAHLGTDYIRKG